mmetsp:Transcript_9497/g.10430  ORF Transcript_9497/g.10430 Transcript_9497/m.10430 type:complete len:158 (+) Transcript_9497:1011-1484(+)
MNNRGRAYEGLDRTEDELACYEEAIKLDPYFTAAYRNKGINHTWKSLRQTYCLERLGLILKNQKKFKEAIEWYDKALIIQPNYAEAFVSKGKVMNFIPSSQISLTGTDKGLSFVQELQREKAIECYDKALEFDSRNDMTLVRKGENYSQRKQCPNLS